MEYVVRLQPASVLDIGPGYGKWGYLIREALDFMDGRHSREAWKTRIDGLDALVQPSPLHDWVYSSVRQGDITSEAHSLPGYDLVVMGDVIEHMTKDEGMSVLRALLSRSKAVVVATPSFFFNQYDPKNPFEEHKSLWLRDDFREWPYDFQEIDGTNVALLAGAGSTWPSEATRRSNDLAYGTPWVRHGAIRPAVAKKVLSRLLK